MEDTKKEIEELKKDNVFTLKKPIKIDGEEVKEIKYDFDELTGNDVDTVFKLARKSGHVITGAYEMDPVLGAYMFAQAAGIDYTDLQRMSASDYTHAGTLGRNFFMQSLAGSQTENI